MRNYIYFIFCVTAWSLTACNDQTTQLIPKIDIEQNLSFSDSFNVILIRNIHNQEVTFELDINGAFPLKMSNIIQSIEDSSSAKSTTVDEEAWRYISRSTFWSNPITLENWQHNPILFLNSIGGGFCDDRATVLAAIWKNWFDSVRVVGLNGHVVSEVYNDEKWKMYDADLKVAYLNSQNQICSVRELEDSTQFISTPHNGKVIGNNPVFETINPTSKRFSNYYKSKEDNEDVSNWHLNSDEPLSTFTIPAHATLKIEINKNTHQTNLSVILTEKSKGKIEIPFVPHSAQGSFEYQLATKNISFEDDFHLFPTNRWIQSIQIQSVKSPSVIRYLVNPKLRFIKPQNQINIKSNLHLEIVKKQETIRSFLPEELSSGLFFDEKSAEYKDFLIHLSSYKGVIDKQYLEKQYILFLASDQKLSKEQKEELYLLFQKDWDKLNFNLKEKEFTIFEKLYPQSAFYFFIASKYRKLNFAKTLLTE